MTTHPKSRRVQTSSTSNSQTSLGPRTLDVTVGRELPQIKAKSPTSHPLLYRKRIDNVPAGVRDGDLVQVTYGSGTVLGYGFFNSKAEIAVRMLSLGPDPIDNGFWDG